MIKISNIKVRLKVFEKFQGCEDEVSFLKSAAARMLGLNPAGISEITVLRRSVDARKDNVFFVYTLTVKTDKEAGVLTRCKNNKDVTLYEQKPDIKTIHINHKSKASSRPVIIGSGPCGLFAGLKLAEAGHRPIIIERGKRADERLRDVNMLWEQGLLNTESNVQFGEGGAGTFSDGKLNTLVKDREGYSARVLAELVKYGAPKEITYVNKPHIGTDILQDVIQNMRTSIEKLGGDFMFSSKVTVLEISKCSATGLLL